MRSRRALARAAALAVVLAGCGNTSPAVTSPAVTPAEPTAAAAVSEAPAPSPPWQPADVVQPSAVTTAPSLLPGVRCDPCHDVAESQLFGVGDSPGGLIAVGVQQPPAQAVAFSSPDGRRWVPVPSFLGATTTAAIAVAASGARTVIVGLEHNGATAWVSDRGSWTQAPEQADLLVPFAAGAMTSVIPFEGGFIAGGYRDDPLHGTASAAVWRSGDGLTWRLDADSGIFSGGRIWGIAASAGTVVAVGTDGNPIYGPAAAWRWTQAAGWQRARLGPDGAGAMRAVTVTATGGFVAVGLNGGDDGARAWTSPDGLTWSVVPDQPAFRYFGLPQRMQAVVVGPAGLVAGGWRSDAGKGSAVTWTSTDGATWQGPTWETSFSGGQITGLVVHDGTAVAVGRTGYPDWNRASAWVSAIP